MDIAKSPYLYSEIVSFVLGEIAAQDLWNDSSRVLIKEKRYWNNQYYIQLKKDLKGNFNEENLKFLSDISDFLSDLNQLKKEVKILDVKKGGKENVRGFLDEEKKMGNIKVENVTDHVKKIEKRHKEMGEKMESLEEFIDQLDPYSSLEELYVNSNKRVK
ncbi:MULTISPECIES: hypothetical protein [Bacillus]|uniref:hypothetical protein n=1 Tax=Bacillus TaxID=1386 RepID=UPI00248110F2|nr:MULTISPECIES: hypothetical protein [Bacillus]MDH8000876.1 hypothetical protein [Bacillus cereus]MDU2391298.1 hypothetical protein [Bacillus sp. (in: firmicutes)]